MSQPAPVPSPGRNAYIDTLRGVSIFGVVCVHFAGSFVTTDIHAWGASFHLGLFLNQAFGFAVPMFVFLSGVLAGFSKDSPTLADYYAGRFRRIAVPYLIASVPAFFLLNHYAEWAALPGLSARVSWLAEHLLFKGVEPTLYFIPLILQLYLLQPLLKALPAGMHRVLPALGPAGWSAVTAMLLLLVHVTLGILCDRGVLNYYVWGRPNVLFWAFYFYAGLHLRALTSLLPRNGIRMAQWAGAALALAAMAWNFSRLLDRTAMGASFEFNRLDFAYVRPEMMSYDLGVVLALGLGIPLGWSVRATFLAYLGRYTLEVYLWHILVLYFGAWRFPAVLASCREVPELIVIICAAATLGIALVADVLERTRAFLRTHRVAVVPRD
jgi:surface polysaccharide O-acyltransferase-like enzyme